MRNKIAYVSVVALALATMAALAQYTPPSGGGSGSGTVSPGTANQAAIYTASTTVGGVTTLPTGLTIPAADTVAGFTGTCNSSTLLGGNGVCQSVTSVPIGTMTILENEANGSGGGASIYGSFGVNGFNGTETNVQSPLPPVAGHLSNFTIVTTTGQSGVGNLVCTVRLAASNTTLAATVPASGAAGAYSDTTHNVAFTASQLLSVDCINNGAGSSANVQGMSLTVTP